MAEKKRKPEHKVTSLDEAQAKRICKVRYGRARLTIHRWGHLWRGPIAEALDAWQRGEKTDEDVAWAYVKARIVEHTPSFRWKDADLEHLIRLVIGCSRSPEIKARDPEALAKELQQERDREIEQLRKLNKEFSKYMRSMRIDWSKAINVWPTSQLAKQWQKSLGLDVGKAALDSIYGRDITRHTRQAMRGLDAGRQAQEALLATSLANRVTTNYDSLLKAATSSMPKVKPLISQLDLSTQETLNELMRTTSVKGLLGDDVIKSMRGSIVIEDVWRAASSAARSARDAQQEQTAEALEITAEVLEEAEAEPAIEVLERAMRPLFEEVIAAIRESKREPNPWLMLILGALLVVALEILATQAGLLGGP